MIVVAAMNIHKVVDGKGTVKINGKKTIISTTDVIAIIASPLLLFFTMALHVAWHKAANKTNKKTKAEDKTSWFYI